MKAIVNGKVMELTYQKQYFNGRENVYECTTADGIWVAVEESTVVVEKHNVRTAFEYRGDRNEVGRVVDVKITGKTEEEVEAAHTAFVEHAAKAGYRANFCSNIEEGRYGKSFVIVESFGVDSAADAEDFKKGIYKTFNK